MCPAQLQQWEMRDLVDWAERFEQMPIEEYHLLGTQSFMQDNGRNTPLPPAES